MSEVYFIVDNDFINVKGNINQSTLRDLRKHLGFMPEDAAFMRRKIRHQWDGFKTTLCGVNQDGRICNSNKACKCVLKKSGVHFPTGVAFKAKKFLESHGCKVIIHDNRTVYDQNYKMSLNRDDIEERDYQKEAVEKMLSSGRGILKSCTELGISPFIFYVPSKSLLKQAKDELERFILRKGKNLQVGVIGDSVCDIKNINVMTVQTAIRSLGQQYMAFDEDEVRDSKDNEETVRKYKDIKELIQSAKGIIADECISGESEVILRDGKCKMKDLSNHVGEDILSFDGTSVVWRKISKFMDKGSQSSINIKTNTGDIICTKDHPIMTQNGWVEAGTIRIGDEILYCSNVNTDKKYQNTSQNQWSTKFSRVIDVEKFGNEQVYDITVDGTHCFFANGMLVHNCHHWRAETCQTISEFSKSARYKIALSATPFRESNDDILIEACFGRVLYDISASELIRQGYLVRPDIYFVPVKNDIGNAGNAYKTIYKRAIVENETRNDYISKLANKLHENGNNIVVLVQQIAHGKKLQSMINNSTFIHGDWSAKKRNKHLESIKKGENPITIATSLLDEGIDCKPWDTLIMAASGKSRTRALQRVGRVIRTYNKPDGTKKERATVIDFDDDFKYLSKHSKQRRKIYKTEKEFNVEDLQL
jgi:superfamily II DNA or RNA helicase